MATSLSHGNLYYRYEIIKKVWTGFLRRNGGYTTASNYFGNFIVRHRTFQFFVIKFHDGTRHIMVDGELYQKIKKELEGKTGKTLPDINPYDLNDPRNVKERQRNYTTQSQFNEHQGELERDNSQIHQRARQDAAEHKKKLYQVLSDKKDTMFLSFDIEVYDQDRKTMLEIGYVKFTLKEGNIPEYFHAIVNEDLHNREGFDNKEKFKFGTTVRMSLEEAAEQLKREIAGSDALVTHAGYNDKQYLAENKIDIEEKSMFDTQVLGLNLLPSVVKCWGLKRMMDELNVRYDETILHNAGNDAHYTMLAFKALVKKAMPGTKF